MQTKELTKALPAFRHLDRTEPNWLYELRKKAWYQYQQEPFPDRVKHLWRYTAPEQFAIREPEKAMLNLPILAGLRDEAEILDEPGVDGFGFNKGDYSMGFKLSPDAQKAGVIFKELTMAAGDRSDMAEKHLGSLVPYNFGKFEALNAAIWNTGTFIYVPKNTVLEKPIYLHRHPTGLVTATRLLVILGENSEASFIDDYSCHCRKEGAIANSVVEIFAGDGARVRYVNLQRLGPDSHTYITHRTQLGADAEGYTIFATLGSAVSKINTGAILNGRGARSHIYGVAVGDAKQHVDHFTAHHHRANDSQSNIDFKVVLKDRAVSAYTGLIEIAEHAINCEAYQENRNLLLNKGTKAETIPELEILNDQVRCTHGATVGPIDPEMVFYLQSRGISKEEATRTIVAGFIEPTINKIPGNLGEGLKEIIFGKLEDH